MGVGCNTSVPKRSMERKTKILQIGWRKIRYRSARPPHRPISRLHNSDPPARLTSVNCRIWPTNTPGLSSTLCRQPSYEYGRSPVPTRIRAARIELRLASMAVTLAPLGTHDATALFLFMAGVEDSKGKSVCKRLFDSKADACERSKANAKSDGWKGRGEGLREVPCRGRT